jgi:hypothetical protein
VLISGLLLLLVRVLLCGPMAWVLISRLLLLLVRVLLCVPMAWILISRLLLLLVRVLLLRLLLLLLLPATVLVCLRVFTVCWLLLRVGGTCSRACVLRIPLHFMQENTQTRSTLECEHINANKTKSTSARQG